MEAAGSAVPPLTLGTAGHIDHGKTSLVAALTGKDTDRLPEEHRRGISIELGYASLELPSGRPLSIVDAPGHERFVRTMVAGASGIDLYLLCVAADDGVMPQTREHLAVLRALGIERGVVAITKADAGEPELAMADVAGLLPAMEAVPVSARKRTGLDELLRALDRAAAEPTERPGSDGEARLHVDRTFALQGIGTVATGTLWSGQVRRGDPVTVLPSGLSARVRSVQVHDEPREAAAAGQRVALNLAGIGWRDLGRGDLIAAAGTRLAPTYLLDAAISLEPGARPLKRGARVHAHHGTREAPARVVPLDAGALGPGERAYAQLRLESPLVPARGDRLVLRQLAPPDTIGGGTVVDPAPRKHGPSDAVRERLRRLERGEDVPDERGGRGPAARDPSRGPPPPPEPALDEAALRLAALLKSDGREPRTDSDLAAAAGLSATEAAERLRRLVRAGTAIRVGPNLHFHAEPLAALEAEVVAICERDGQATIAGVRDALATSRKYAQALLEHLDAAKVTRRRGDAHVLRA